MNWRWTVRRSSSARWGLHTLTETVGYQSVHLSTKRKIVRGFAALAADTMQNVVEGSNRRTGGCSIRSGVNMLDGCVFATKWLVVTAGKVREGGRYIKGDRPRGCQPNRWGLQCNVAVM